MRWENPEYLLGLWIIPLVGLALMYAHRKRISTARQFADPIMLDRLMPNFQGLRPWVRGAALLMGLACLIISVSRPRFGVKFEKLSQRGVDVFVLLDVSRSMLAEDVAPNRLERAKSDIRDVLDRLRGDRIGLVVFAGAAVVKVPLTSDHGFYRMVLDDVGSHSAPRGGSLIGDAIRQAMAAMEKRRDRDQVIVLITDGEDHDSFPAEAAKQAAELGIKIFTVGLGDAGEGARIPVRDDTGQLSYIKHDGQEVWSRMDERLLKEIALSTSGAYIPAQTRVYDLGEIYEDHLAKLSQGETHSEKRKRYLEQFQVFACLGLALLLIEMMIPSYQRQTPHHDSQPLA